MITSKQDFLRTFLPDKVTELNYAQINLDITDLSIADILRNVDQAYPPNSRKRNDLIGGTSAVAILCKAETLDPMMGLFLIIANDELEFEIISKNYIVISISESKIRDREGISEVIKALTTYLTREFKQALRSLPDFYRKYVYDPYELTHEDGGEVRIDF